VFVIPSRAHACPNYTYGSKELLSGLAIAGIITLIIIVLIIVLLLGYVFARLQMWRKQVIDAKKMLEAENQLNHHLELSTSHKIDNSFNSNLYTQSNSRSAKKYEN
jgi:flagellar basal body-associated protein FliL